MSKKTMKMKRVDDNGDNGSVIKDGGGAKMMIRQPVKTSSGAIVVSNVEDEVDEPVVENTEPFVPQQTAEPSKVRGVVTVSAPNDALADVDGEDEEMEEVSYEDWAREQQVAISSDNPNVSADPTTAVRALAGKTEKFAKKLLTEMKEDGKIADFRFVPMGQPMTLEMNPGRVQCLVDGMGNVINVEIS